jgi:ribosomal protein S18 acetylase RimI-like enzyme
VLQAPPDAVRVIDVTAAMVPAVAALAEACALETTSTLNQGFLVSGYTAADYLRFCDQAVDFVVAGDGTPGIAGFALTLAEDHGVYISQVAVSPLSKRRGVGRRLYEELLRRHPTDQISAHIVREPMNIASIAFHEALGFVFEGEIPGEERFRPGRWVRKPVHHDRNVTS